MIRDWMGGVLRHPLPQFLALGLLIHVAWPGRESPHPTAIHIDAPRVATLATDWQRRHGQPPSQQRLRALVEQDIDEELMVRHARALGLDHNNPTVNAILLANLRYAGFDAESDAALLQIANRLGLAAADPLVRRYLAETVRLLWAQPTDGQAAGNADPEPVHERLYSFEQRFFATEAEAQAHLQLLVEGEAPAPGGPAFPLGDRFSARSAGQVAAQLGPALARAVAEAIPGAWQGPVASTWGWHLLRREEAGSSPESADLASPAGRQVQSRLALQARLAEARRQSEIRVDWPAELSGSQHP